MFDQEENKWVGLSRPELRLCLILVLCGCLFRKEYDTSAYHGPHCQANSQGGEINPQCRFDIVDEKQSTATHTIASLRSHGYRLCFGCGNTAIHGHCPEVVVCVKQAKCYKQSKGTAGYTFGCCDTRCGLCPGHCEGEFCNADASLQAFIPPTPTTTTSTTTTTTTTRKPTTTTTITTTRKPTTTTTTTTITTTKPTTPRPTTLKTTTPFINTWSEWSAWLGCVSTMCPNQGVQARYRNCLVRNCDGQATDSRLCTTPCVQTTTQSYWTEWSSWSECVAASCGGQGFRVRTRTCQAGVGKCPGDDNSINTCIATACTTQQPTTTTKATKTTTTTTTTTPTTTTPNVQTKPMTCADNNYAINGNCSYWLNFQLCDPGSDIYEAIGNKHCRKTCGLCG